MAEWNSSIHFLTAINTAVHSHSFVPQFPFLHLQISTDTFSILLFTMTTTSFQDIHVHKSPLKQLLLVHGDDHFQFTPASIIRCNKEAIEPHLQPIQGEDPGWGKVGRGSRWLCGKQIPESIFDLRVANPFTPRISNPNCCPVTGNRRISRMGHMIRGYGRYNIQPSPSNSNQHRWPRSLEHHLHTQATRDLNNKQYYVYIITCFSPKQYINQAGDPATPFTGEHMVRTQTHAWR